jgi:hypothetical protein
MYGMPSRVDVVAGAKHPLVFSGYPRIIIRVSSASDVISGTYTV